MNPKIRITAILSAVAVLCAASSGALVVTRLAKEPADVPAAPISPSEPAGTSVPPETGYRLAELGGCIGVYYMGELLYCTDISVYSLREADRTLLQEGVRAETYGEVLSLLEDFGS